MPSPFPGMDPFIESQEWSDFHTTFMTVIREQLSPLVRPRFMARVERRVYLEQPFGTDHQAIPDVAIVERDEFSTTSGGPGTATAATSLAPVTCLLPEAEEHHEYYLVIRDKESRRIVTMIELLSPTNKRPNSEGERQYLSKRNETLGSQTNLVELDLLRGGNRLPMSTPLPSGDYFAIVKGRKADVYAWTVKDRLPTIPIPLDRELPEVQLDLQAAFDLTYDRAAYEDSLDRKTRLNPNPTDELSQWIDGLLSSPK